VTDDERMVLIHAELDGDLSSEQRADLARLLLADPQARALRDEFRSVCSRLDAVGQVEPPPQFKDSILNRLPSRPAATTYRVRQPLAACRDARGAAGGRVDRL